MTGGWYDGDLGGGEATLVLNEQFGQDVANLLRFTAATPVVDAGNTVSMISPNSC